MAGEKWKELTLENLHLVDGGKVAAALNHHIRMAMADCEERPHEERARKVTLEITLTPIPDEIALSASHVEAQFQFRATIPKAQTRQYMMPVARYRDHNGRTRVDARFFPEEDQEMDMFHGPGAASHEPPAVDPDGE